jgi:flagellar basal-body rod modification protein FlgD
MATFGLDQISSKGGQTASGTTSPKDIMGKDEFLRLLVAQLEAQDPLNPMDGTDFTAQLAQFSSLEQLQNMNATLGTLNTSQSVLTNSQAVSYIGKTISAVGDTTQVQDGTSSDLHFSLENDSIGSYIAIHDAYGNFVRQIETGPMQAGAQQIAWDGRDRLGRQVPDGVYSFKVEAIDEAGNSVPVTQFTSGVVTGVNFKNGLAYLQCGNREIALGNVVQVNSQNGQP